VLLKDARVIKKRSTYELPDEEVLNAPLDKIEFGKYDRVSGKRKVTNILLMFFLPLFILTLLDRIAVGWSFYRNLKRKSKDFKLENIERALGIEKAEEEAPADATSEDKPTTNN
jgi:hypothetical protein